MTAAAPSVAVVSHRELREFLLKRLLQQGYPDVVSCVAEQVPAQAQRLADVIKAHQPRLVIYDLAPPYEQSWAVCQQVRELDGGPARPYIVTVEHAALPLELQDAGVLTVEQDVQALMRLLQRVRDLLKPA